MIRTSKFGNDFRAFLKRIVRFFGQCAIGNPFLKRKAIAYLSKRPALKVRLRRVVQGAHGDQSVEEAYFAPDHMGQTVGQASYRDSVLENGSERKSLVSVNGSQKTPLESYFY